MYQVTKEIPFCYGHRLLNYDGKCKNLHGHNGIAEITLATDELDESGFVVDFSVIKQIVAKWIDENFDHRMLLHKDDPVVDYLTKQGEPIKVLAVNPSAENIARLIYDFVESEGLPIVQVKLWETPSCFAVYGTAGHDTAGNTKVAAGSVCKTR
ncbi:MAG TPA: 6-carboxytetrahydropterin synthase [Planktothrix sp.]|jgi:6-pyruvoyltetrahydropterin/6-carboxytetrahydropterin synthase